MTARLAAWCTGGAMLVVYAATLAPSVTFWDAGEFIAAARVLGIPHPPGTPLFILLLNSWARLWWFLPFAVATNLFSAVCTAAAVALTALWLARGAPTPIVAVGSITAGAMTSVWQNATETEVYAASLALAIGAIATADLAGRSGERRWLVLTAYLLALAVPLHLSALVAAPVVIYLATHRADGQRDWSAGAALMGVSLISMGLSRLSAFWTGAGIALLVASPFAPGDRTRSLSVDTKTVAMTCFAALVALSALLFLLIRSQYDPAINQGNPSDWRALADVVGRRQYAIAAPWPRQAPWWLQIANWFEYADWQFALSLGPSVIPTVSRVLATLGFAALGIIGARWHRSVDRRTWRAVGLLFVCGSLGVIAYLNLKAGSSFGWRFVPDDAQHEARDRDYFFVLSFWAWGIWAGLGAIRLSEWVGVPIASGVAVAMLPIVLNWTAVDRRVEPEASLPREVAVSLLDPLPAHAVLFVAGDNDTYPLWYAQQVERRRRDVTVVTMPLLAAIWYVDELRRREGLDGLLGMTVEDRSLRGDLARSRRIAAAAQQQGRPVAVAVTVPAGDRNRMQLRWKVIGTSLVAVAETPESQQPSFKSVPGLQVDAQLTRIAAEAAESWRRGRVAHPSTDPVHSYFLRVLSCPTLVLQASPSNAQLASLDSTCNLR